MINKRSLLLFSEVKGGTNVSLAGETTMLSCKRYNVSTGVQITTWTHPNGM